MPVNVKRREKEGVATGIVAGSGEEPGATFDVFVLRAHWFSLDQTEGADFVPEMIVPSWDPATALAALDVKEVPFEQLCGNVMGCARARSIAISALNPFKHKTRFHELAHVVLGHTAEGDISDTDVRVQSLRSSRHELSAWHRGRPYTVYCSIATRTPPSTVKPRRVVLSSSAGARLFRTAEGGQRTSLRSYTVKMPSSIATASAASAAMEPFADTTDGNNLTQYGTRPTVDHT